MSNMVGVLQQLVDLSNHAAELYTTLFVDVNQALIRISDLKSRVSIVKMVEQDVDQVLSKSQISDFYEPKVHNDYRRQDLLRCSSFAPDSAPYSLQVRRQRADPPPPLYLIDEAGMAGADAMKQYSNPNFFVEQWLIVEKARQEKSRQERREARRKAKLNKEKKKHAAPAMKQGRKDVAQVSHKVYNPMGHEFAGVKDTPTAVPKKANVNHSTPSRAPPPSAHSSAPTNNSSKPPPPPSLEKKEEKEFLGHIIPPPPPKREFKAPARPPPPPAMAFAAFSSEDPPPPPSPRNAPPPQSPRNAPRPPLPAPRPNLGNPPHPPPPSMGSAPPPPPSMNFSAPPSGMPVPPPPSMNFSAPPPSMNFSAPPPSMNHSASPPPEPIGEEDGRDGLLAAIRQGKKLKKTETTAAPKRMDAQQASIMQLLSRRAAIASDDEASDGEGDEDSDWE